MHFLLPHIAFEIFHSVGLRCFRKTLTALPPAPPPKRRTTASSNSGGGDEGEADCWTSALRAATTFLAKLTVVRCSVRLREWWLEEESVRIGLIRPPARDETASHAHRSMSPGASNLLSSTTALNISNGNLLSTLTSIGCACASVAGAKAPISAGKRVMQSRRTMRRRDSYDAGTGAALPLTEEGRSGEVLLVLGEGEGGIEVPFIAGPPNVMGVAGPGAPSVAGSRSTYATQRMTSSGVLASRTAASHISYAKLARRVRERKVATARTEGAISGLRWERTVGE